MKDVLGQAIYDYHFKQKPSRLWIHNTYGMKEDMPVKLYFRRKEKMPRLEQIALQECYGSVLDIGAGAGSHALALQKSGFNVSVIDISPNAVAVMKDRGVQKADVCDAFHYTGEPVDTVLMLMNGIGLVGTLDGLKTFLQHARTLIKENGQLIFDSSNVAYLYNYEVPQHEIYYGVIAYKYEYKKETTDWFTWLYVDQKTLTGIAGDIGWKTEVLYEDQHDQYLAKLTLK